MAYDLSALQNQLQNTLKQYQQAQWQSPYSQPSPYPNLPVQQQVPPVIPMQPHQVQYVGGIAGARLYQQNELVPNSSEVIMDKDDNIFYLVSKDANGIPSKRITAARFTIEQIDDEEPGVLTRKDFNDFKEEIRKLIADSQNSIVLTTKKNEGDKL